jgi:hypothetical protein
MRRAIIGLVVAASVMLGTGATAHAGEVNGRGEPIPGAFNASSACAFSGLDTPDDIEDNPPGFDDDAIAIHGAQSYGQFVAAGLKDEVPSPGIACRGNS